MSDFFNLYYYLFNLYYYRDCHNNKVYLFIIFIFDKQLFQPFSPLNRENRPRYNGEDRYASYCSIWLANNVVLFFFYQINKNTVYFFICSRNFNNIYYKSLTICDQSRSVTMFESQNLVKFHLLFFQIILENFQRQDINIFANIACKFFINNKVYNKIMNKKNS